MSVRSRKRPQDGDEKKTHLCIRFADGQMRFLEIDDRQLGK